MVWICFVGCEGKDMERTVAQKMGIKEGVRAIFSNAPAEAVEAIKLPDLDLTEQLKGEFGYIHVFVKTQEEMLTAFPKLKKHLAPGGMLWVSWPKGRQLGTDLTLPQVIRIGYNLGLVESTALSINAVWSALKFTHPKSGKLYNNKYGQLKL